MSHKKQVLLSSCSTEWYEPKVDNYWTEGYRIDEEDAHDWGEWVTILSGIQEGR